MSADDYPAADHIDVGDLDKRLRTKLNKLCTRYRDIHAEIKELSDDKAGLMVQVLQLVRDAGYDGIPIAGDSWKLVPSIGRRSTLKKEKLLEQGVTMEQIKAATEVTEKPYYQIREFKSDF